MASGKEHRAIGTGVGAVVGGATYLAVTPRSEWSFWKFLASACAGAALGRIGAQVHDALEPATSSHHRRLGHSIVANGAALVAGARAVSPLLESKEEASRALGIAGVTFMAGAATHLGADAATPRGLPILGLPRLTSGRARRSTRPIKKRARQVSRTTAIRRAAKRR